MLHVRDPLQDFLWIGLRPSNPSLRSGPQFFKTPEPGSSVQQKNRGSSSCMLGSSVISCLVMSLHSCTKPQGLTLPISSLLYSSRIQEEAGDIRKLPKSWVRLRGNHCDNYRFSKQGSQQKYHTLDAPEREKLGILEKHRLLIGEDV